VTSTAGAATLTVVDPGGTGRLANGTATLGEPLQVRANTAAFAALSGNPVTLHSYSAPVSNDAVTLAFRQHIAANQALRTGNYSKTVTFTLATATP
jgi:hypothetical protein